MILSLCIVLILCYLVFILWFWLVSFFTTREIDWSNLTTKRVKKMFIVWVMTKMEVEMYLFFFKIKRPSKFPRTVWKYLECETFSIQVCTHFCLAESHRVTNKTWSWSEIHYITSDFFVSYDFAALFNLKLTLNPLEFGKFTFILYIVGHFAITVLFFNTFPSADFFS